MKKIFSGKILTVPNLLSFLRLGLVPLFTYLYIFRAEYSKVLFLLVLSAITDVLDGFIARRFDMVSDLGKALDPLADKLTQAAILFCLVERFPLMLLPLSLLVVKESCCAILSLAAIERTDTVDSADWHGKLNTALLYALSALHLAFPGISPAFSNAFILVCTGVMSLSFALYIRRFLRITH